MRKLVLLLLLLSLQGIAYAQYQPTYKRSGATLKMDGEKLSKQESMDLLTQMGGEQLSSDWKKASDWRTAGIVMTAAGGTVGVASGFVFLLGALVSGVGAVFGAGTAAVVVTPIGGEEAGKEAASQAADQGAKAGVPYMIGGMVGAGLGFGTMIAGIPILVSNCKRMDKMAAGLNEPRPVAVLGFGATANGTGLYLRF